MPASVPTQVDYSELFTALSNFQKGDSRFKDYDFEASGVNSINKVLAANSAGASLSAYFITNETFISTSEIPENVQALATPQSGYVPFGKKSSTIVVNLTVTPPDPQTAPASLTLPKTFNTMGVGNGKTFTFSPLKTYSAPLVDDVYLFEGVLLVEGQLTTNSFTQDGSAIAEYVIPNKNIDISTLEVSVRVGENDRTTEVWERFNSAFQLGSDSELFFLSMNREGYYKVEFGDNALSKALDNGNIIFTTYLVSTGSESNGISQITPTSEIGGFSNISLEVLSPAKGGSEPEGIDVIKSKSKTSYGMDGLAVVDEEYEIKLSQLLPAYKVNAWGGEDAVPQRPGYTLFTTFPELSEPEQEYITGELNKVSVGSILTIYSTYDTFGISVDVFFVTNGGDTLNLQIKQTITSLVKDYAEKTTDFNGTFSPRTLEDELQLVEGVERVYVTYAMSSPVQVSDSGFTFDYNRQIDNVSFVATFEGDVTFDKVKDTGSGFYKFLGDVQGAQVITNVNYLTGVITLEGFNTSIVECTSNRVDPAGQDMFYQARQYQLLQITLGSIES